MFARLGVVLAVIWLLVAIPIIAHNGLPLLAYIILGVAPAAIIAALGAALSWVFAALFDR